MIILLLFFLNSEEDAAICDLLMTNWKYAQTKSVGKYDKRKSFVIY